jgi:hypothetical protein
LNGNKIKISCSKKPWLSRVLYYKKTLSLPLTINGLYLQYNCDKSYKHIFGMNFWLKFKSNFTKIISLIAKVDDDKKKLKPMADIDHKIISHFLCTHRLDSTRVDLDPYLSEDDLIFFPVKDPHNLKEIYGINMDRYNERIKMLFNPYREKN